MGCHAQRAARYAPARHMHQECRTSAGRQEKVRINHLKPCDLVINMLIASMVAMDRSRALLECAAQRQYCAVRTSLLAAHKGPVAGKVFHMQSLAAARSCSPCDRSWRLLDLAGLGVGPCAKLAFLDHEVTWSEVLCDGCSSYKALLLLDLAGLGVTGPCAKLAFLDHEVTWSEVTCDGCSSYKALPLLDLAGLGVTGPCAKLAFLDRLDIMRGNPVAKVMGCRLHLVHLLPQGSECSCVQLCAVKRETELAIPSA
eukprot:745376-Pelagomonas_calceolata.AAC.1